MKTENDGVNAEIKHFYNSQNGLLKATVNGGYGTTYNYDALYRLSGIMENFLLSDGSYGSFVDCEEVNYTYQKNSPKATHPGYFFIFLFFSITIELSL